MKLKDCKHGKVYYWTTGYNHSHGYLNLFQNIPGESNNIECYITNDINQKNNNVDRLFYKNSSNSSPYDIREATPEEEHWLLTCKEANTFVEYKTAMLSFRQPNVITKDSSDINEILIKLLS